MKRSEYQRLMRRERHYEAVADFIETLIGALVGVGLFTVLFALYILGYIG